MRDTKANRALVAEVLRTAKRICEKGGGKIKFVPFAGEGLADLVIEPGHPRTQGYLDRLKELEEEVLEYDADGDEYTVTA